MPDGLPRPWTLTGDGLRLTVHLTPKSSRDAIESIMIQSDGMPVLKVRVRAIPENGKANAALIETLAKALHVPRSALTLEAGGKSRMKIVSIKGGPQELAASIEAALEVAS
jgi:uncharacterized protein (TIGR00251 family)